MSCMICGGQKQAPHLLYCEPCFDEIASHPADDPSIAMMAPSYQIYKLIDFVTVSSIHMGTSRALTAYKVFKYS